jgi:hypothetical protein
MKLANPSGSVAMTERKEGDEGWLLSLCSIKKPSSDGSKSRETVPLLA